MTLCVYAITGPQPLSRTARGMDGEPLRLVVAGRLAAIVGELRRRPRPTRGALDRYDAAIGRLHARRHALLPARYGSCFAGLGEVAFVLRSREGTLRAALARVRGRAQMTVRVLPSTPRQDATGAAPARIVNPRSRGRTPSGRGARYLHERAARTTGIPGFDPVREAVRRWVRAERVEASGRIASVYHLVPRAAAAPYVRAAVRAARAAGQRVIITGPWPPYAFAGW